MDHPQWLNTVKNNKKFAEMHYKRAWDESSQKSVLPVKTGIIAIYSRLLNPQL